MSSPRELMRDIEHNDLESGEDILTPRDLWYQLCEMVEKQEEELDHANKTIKSLLLCIAERRSRNMR